MLDGVVSKELTVTVGRGRVGVVQYLGSSILDVESRGSTAG